MSNHIASLPLVAARSKLTQLAALLADDPLATKTAQGIKSRMEEIESNLGKSEDTFAVFDMVKAVGALNNYYTTGNKQHLDLALSFCKTKEQINEEYLNIIQTGEYAL